MPGDFVTDPDAGGYFFDVAFPTAKMIRKTRFRNNVSYKCYKHGPKCTLAIGERFALSDTVLKGWALSVRWPQAGDDAATIASLRDAHMEDLRRLRASHGGGGVPTPPPQAGAP